MRTTLTLALCLLMGFSMLALAGCGPGDPPVNTVENPQRGDGDSVDGIGRQAEADSEADAVD